MEGSAGGGEAKGAIDGGDGNRRDGDAASATTVAWGGHGSTGTRRDGWGSGGASWDAARGATIHSFPGASEVLEASKH